MKETYRSLTVNGREIRYLFERKDIKTIRMRVHRDGIVCVSAPTRLPLRTVESFVAKNADFALAASERAKLKLAATLHDLSEGDMISFLGKELAISLANGKSSVRVEHERIVLSLPDPSDGEARQQLLSKWLRAECEQQVKLACQALWPHFEGKVEKYPQIKLRHMVSQWGNCRSTSGVITFSTRLISHPVECIEYVAAHELCHLVYSDHSSRFYALLSDIMPNWKQRREKLAQTRYYLR